jgi:long-subunit acyl-CoA synthetase (AMP-forming)
MRRSKVRMLFTVTDFLDSDYVGGAARRWRRLARRDRRAAPIPDGTVSFTTSSRASAVDDTARQQAAAVQGDDICHVLFTSGTEAPKGAMLTTNRSAAYLIFSEVIGLREATVT